MSQTGDCVQTHNGRCSWPGPTPMGSSVQRVHRGSPGSYVCTAWCCRPFLGSLSSDAGSLLPGFSSPSSPGRTFLPLLSVFPFLALWTRGFSLLTPTPDFTPGPALFLGVFQHQGSHIPRGHHPQDRKAASQGLGVCEIF